MIVIIPFVIVILFFVLRRVKRRCKAADTHIENIYDDNSEMLFMN